MATTPHLLETPRQRRQLGGLLLAWVAFILFGSWVPLDFHWRDPAEVWAALWQWSAAGALREQRLDTVVNVLVTVPLGFGLALLWAGPRARAPLLARAAIVLLVLPLSLLAELGQGFLPGRSESLGDVLAQTAGTVLGVALHAGFGARAQGWLTQAQAAMQARSRAAHLLYAYLAALLIAAVMPLDFTLDVGELYHKWRDGRVVWLPFGDIHGTASEIVFELVTDVLLWVPAGALWRLDAPRRTARAIAARVGLAALGIECVQLFVLARVSDVTDVLLAMAGGALGWRLVGWLAVAGPGQAGVAQAPAARAPPRQAGRSPARRTPIGWMRPLASILVLAAASWLLARLPGVPYNVAKLMPAGRAGIEAALGLALAAWWIAVLPAAMTQARRGVAVALPLWLVLHGLAAFFALRQTVAPAMLHKVIGSPVLGWPGFGEDLLRYLALHVALLLALCGGAALVQAVRRPAAFAGLLYWFLLAAALAWPLHWAVMEQAATDNLTELMRGGGGFAASSWLASSVMAVGTAAGAAASLAYERGRRRGGLVLLLALAAAAAPLALLAGLEPVVFKYGKAFSALQFILSAGRDAYAGSTELAGRYAIAWVAVTGTLAWLQAPWWGQGAAAGPGPRTA